MCWQEREGCVLWLQSVLDQFDSLTLGPSGPGQQQDPMQSPAYYPRPTGEEAAAARAPLPLAHPGNCEPRFMRPTVNAVPAQQVPDHTLT